MSGQEKTFVTAFLASLLLGSFALAVPPSPEAEAGWSDAARGEFIRLQYDAASRGLDKPNRDAVQLQLQRGRDDPQETTLLVPVILVDFDDNQADRENHGADRYESLLFSLDEYQTGSMRDYYLEISGGAVSIEGVVVGWFRAPQSYAYYTNRQYGIGAYPRNAQRLAEDALRAANESVDFSDFDNDGDGVVESPFIVHAGGGAEENPNNNNLIWSHAWNVVNLGEMDGVRFYGYTTVPEDGKIGVFSHELGHSLFGLPDLYDTRNRGVGLGIWSLMAYGSWGDQGRRPTHPDAWCKLQLGWIRAPFLTHDQQLTLPAIYDSARALKLWTPDVRDGEYFLAEHRARRGFDGALPGGGLLIYHIDERMPNNDHPWYPGNEGNQHDLVALEQADDDWHLERADNAGDAGDPYPGAAGVRTFDGDTSPGSDAYSGDATGVAILEIQLVDGGVSAEWRIGRENPPEAMQTLALHEGWNLVSLRTTPPDLEIPSIFAPLVEAEALVFVKDGSGRFFAPGFNYNNIPFWDVRAGYLVKVSRDVELGIDGEEIEFDRPIPLRNGWQTIAYFPNYPLTPLRAFGQLGNALEMVKDGSGRFYAPRWGFNNMGNLSPGQGYLLKHNGVGELVYPVR